MTRIAITDTAVDDESLERALASELGAEVRACSDGLSLEAALTDADLVFTNFGTLDERALRLVAPGALLVRYGVGVDSIDLDAAARLGLRVANVPDYGANVVADHALALLLALVRRIPSLDRASRASAERPELEPVQSLESLTLGLVGAGRIARMVAARAMPFGITVLASDPFADAAALAAEGVELVELDAMLGRCDAVSLHAPLTTDTQHVIEARTLGLLRRGAFLVNTARGGLVDHDALLDALESGRLAGVALDVTEPEPLPAEHPLRSRDDVILTPHVAFLSVESLQRLQSLAVDEGRRFLRGEPLRCPVPLPTQEQTG